MKYKTFASAFIAAIAFVSTSVFAAITYDDSNNSSAYAQTGDAEVVQGSSARANDIIVSFGASGDIAAKKTITLRLPPGLNFESSPSFALTTAAGGGLSLRDSAGDPTKSSPEVTMSDTDSDGGMDKAVVTTSVAAAGGDTMTVTVRVAANADAKVGLKKITIIPEGINGTQADLVSVIKTAPTLSVADSALITVDQTATAPLAITTPTIGVVLPAGAKNGNTLTISVNGKLRWDDGTSTVSIVANSIKAPVTTVPLTGTIGWGGTGSAGPVASGGNNGTYTITLSVQGAPTTGFTDPVPLTLKINSMEMAAGSAVGTEGVTIAGSAGVAGKANIVNVKANGSSAALNTGAKITKIVNGSKSLQTLPTIKITENFDGDLTNGTATVTIKAPTGMKFDPSSAGITVTGATNSGGTYTTSVHTFNLTANASGTSVTIAGMSATVSVEGALSVTVGGADIDSKYGPKGDSVQVAEGIAVGTVNVTGPKTLAKVGPKTTGSTSAVTLKETTYGSLSTAAAKSGATGNTKAYITVTPTNAKITAVATSTSYAKGAPTFAACAVEATGSATWVCEVTAESSALLAGTDTITVTPTWSTDGAVGDTVSFTIGGNAGVSGTADVATVNVATEAKTGVVPQLTIGSADTQSLAAITITENFTDGIKAGQFRVIAPAGVKFSSTAFKLFAGQTDTVVVSTFNTNDTLVLSPPNTPSITFTPKVIVSDAVSVGDITFDIIDGDIDGATKTGLTGESVNAGYAVAEIKALSGGADISVGASFSSTNAITGGVGTKTAKSSAAGVATVAVDGDSITVTGVAAGAATITVTDALGATDAVAVTVTAAEQTAAKAGKALDGSDLPEGTAFSAGASKDGGATQATEFTTADTVEIVATVEVGTDIQGEAGGIHVALLTKSGSDSSFSFLNEDGNYETWDISGLPGVHIDADALAASYNISLYSGKLAAGTYRFALAYSSGGNVYYTGKAITLTVTE